MFFSKSLLKNGMLFFALTTLASPALATRFNLVPLDLGSGWSMGGTVDTDGTVGTLGAANIASWNIVVRSVTDYVYDKSNTVNFSADVYSNGTQLLIPTSPDGFSDGGALRFWHSLYNQVRVADFTGAYVSGGQALYIRGSAFNSVPLNQPEGARYEAATGIPSRPNVFNLKPVDFGFGVKMTGTVETDGTLGLTNLVDWNVTVREVWSFTFTTVNSIVKYAFGVSTDGQALYVTPFDEFGNGGYFGIGFGGADPTLALLADYSWLPQGQAGYIDPFGMFTVSPLPLDSNGNYVVARATGAETLTPVKETVRIGSSSSGGGLASWAADDGNARRLCRAFVPNFGSPFVRVDLDYSTTKLTPNTIDFVVKARMAHAGSNAIRGFLHNVSSNAFDQVLPDSPLALTFMTFTGSPASDLANYVSPTGGVTTRIEVQQTGLRSVAAPCAEFEFAQLRMSD